jgi:SAM-dependent methyltransferase
VQIESGNRWRQALTGWSIPRDILDQAPESPWIHPPALFQIPDVIEDSISHQRAREAMPEGGTILDIGCGGGIAAFAITPPATQAIGVDHQLEMLAMFSENAKKRNVTSTLFEGFWPEVASQVPVADVATAHHVVFNVQAIEDFLIAINNHATKRVVIEMPQQHPLANAAPLWKHFWNVDRPTTPTPNDLMTTLHDLGFEARQELWDGKIRQEGDIKTLAHYSRIRLCLPASREDEVYEFLLNQPLSTARPLATIWWDTK